MNTTTEVFNFKKPTKDIRDDAPHQQVIEEIWPIKTTKNNTKKY